MGILKGVCMDPLETLDQAGIVIEEFTELPSRAGGGGGRNSETMDAVRALKPGQKFTIPETFNNVAERDSRKASLASYCSGNAKLPFKATVRGGPDNTIWIGYHPSNTYTSIPHPRRKNRFLTVGEAVRTGRGTIVNGAFKAK